MSENISGLGFDKAIAREKFKYFDHKCFPINSTKEIALKLISAINIPCYKHQILHSFIAISYATLKRNSQPPKTYTMCEKQANKNPSFRDTSGKAK